MNTAEFTAPGARAKTPMHLWIVGVVALLWNSMGAFDYAATQFKMESYMSAFTAEQLEYFYGFPAWAVTAWAIAVWVGLAATVGLLMRKKWAFVAYAISLAGLATSSIYTLVLTNGLEIMGPPAPVMTALIWAISIFLVWYSRRLVKAGVLA